MGKKPEDAAHLIERLSVREVEEIAREPDLGARIDAYQDRAPYPADQFERTERRVWLAEKLPKRSVGAEIGVFRGHFAEVLAGVAQPKLLYLVDPWTVSGKTFGWGNNYTNKDTLRTADAYDEAKLRAARGGARELTMIQGYFPACASAITHQLDWAYLDSSHSYEGTVADLEALDRLVAPDGVIAGDDWRPKVTDRHHGVFQAVQEFTQKSNWKLVMCGYLGQWMLKQY